MQNEVPDKVSLVVRIGESQADFARRLFMEAARLAGMPLLEQISFADNMTKSGEHLFIGKDEKPRLKWLNDPTPKDNDLLVSDKEWKAKYEKWHTHVLNDFNKQELKRRQAYYVLSGGELGSLREIPFGSDVIIVDLNFVYEKSQFDLAKANVAYQKHIAYAELVYGVIEIKFFSTWTPGTGDPQTQTIKEGRKEHFVNIFLSIGKQKGAESKIEAYLNEDTGEITTKDIFLTRGQLEAGSVFIDNSLRVGALAHELGHKFGNLGPEVSVAGYTFPTIRNIISDQQIDSAINRLLSGKVRKGIEWKRSGFILPNRSGTIEYLTEFDKIRIGARSLARKI